jgi:RNA polymerase sigma-70 factor (ECF subfamily)
MRREAGDRDSQQEAQSRPASQEWRATIVKSKDAVEFTALWTAAQTRIAAFIRTLVPDLDESDELLQRVAVALVQKFDQFDKKRSFVAWAIGMAKYEILYHRRQKAYDKLLFDDDLIENLAEYCEELSGEWDHYRDALVQCLDQLEGRSKRAIMLRYAEGLRSDAIGRDLKLSSAAVRVMLCRIRKVLRDCIERAVGPEATT